MVTLKIPDLEVVTWILIQVFIKLYLRKLYHLSPLLSAVIMIDF